MQQSIQEIRVGLLYTSGEVVAISTAKMPFAHGIGFAVPINIAKSIMNDS
jgi:serine protease Do